MLGRDAHFSVQEKRVDEQLAARYTAVIWVDCGASLQVKLPQFALDIRLKALALARGLGVSYEAAADDTVVNRLRIVLYSLQQIFSAYQVYSL